jgi:hypothetical protein
MRYTLSLFNQSKHFYFKLTVPDNDSLIPSSLARPRKLTAGYDRTVTGRNRYRPGTIRRSLHKMHFPDARVRRVFIRKQGRGGRHFVGNVAAVLERTKL